MFVLEFIEEMLSLIGLGSLAGLAALGVVGKLLLWGIYIFLAIIWLVVAIGVLYAMYYWPREFVYRIVLRKEPPPERIMMWFDRVNDKIDKYIEEMDKDT